jgi:hypothetical protein
VLASCVNQPERALVVRIDVAIDVTSPLPADVTLSFQVQGSEIGNDVVIVGFSEGASCTGFMNLVSFKGLSPTNPGKTTLWYVIGNAITPNAPHGDANSLGEHSMYLANFTIAGDSPLVSNIVVQGSRVCGDFETDDIVVAGNLPSGCHPRE